MYRRPGISISWASSAVIWRNTPRLGPPSWNCPVECKNRGPYPRVVATRRAVSHAHPDGLKNGIVLRAHIDIGLYREIVVGLELVDEGAELLRQREGPVLGGKLTGLFVLVRQRAYLDFARLDVGLIERIELELQGRIGRTDIDGLRIRSCFGHRSASLLPIPEPVPLCVSLARPRRTSRCSELPRRPVFC